MQSSWWEMTFHVFKSGFQKCYENCSHTFLFWTFLFCTIKNLFIIEESSDAGNPLHQRKTFFRQNWYRDRKLFKSAAYKQNLETSILFVWFLLSLLFSRLPCCQITRHKTRFPRDERWRWPTHSWGKVKFHLQSKRHWSPVPWPPG